MAKREKKSAFYQREITQGVNGHISCVGISLEISVFKLREVFTALKMNIMTEASKLMSKDQFDVRKGPNLKMQFKHAF